MSLLREPPGTRFTYAHYSGRPGALILLDKLGNPYASNLIVNLSTMPPSSQMTEVAVSKITTSTTQSSDISLTNTATNHVGGVPVVNGGVLFVENGSLKFHGGNGTITTLADA